MTDFFEVIESICTLTEAEKHLIKSCLHTKTHKKGTLLIEKGQVASQLFFVNQGVLHEYVETDGNQVTTDLISENRFYFSNTGFLQNRPSTSYLKALEKTQLTYIYKEKYEELLMIIPKLEKVVRIILEKHLISNAQNMQLLRLSNASGRYELFLKTYPELIDRIPLKHVASLLNIRSETLSRVRSGFMKG